MKVRHKYNNRYRKIMSEQDNETLRAEVMDFLNTHRKAVFAILDKNGLPTTSLMLYAVDDELNVYFGTRRSFGKYADITRQPVISLSVIEEAIDPLKVADIRGTAIEVPDEECGTTCAFFKTKNPSKYYVEGAPDFVMFKIVPSFVRFADATTGELKVSDLTLGAVPLG
jgi:general stress protein 26